MRKAPAAAAALAALAAVAAGCGGVSLDPVAQAASKTAAAGSFRFSYALSLGLGGSQQQAAIAGDGAYDASARRLQATMGVDKQQLELILDASAAAPALYVKPPAGETGLPPGKTWGKLDLAQAAKQGGLDLGRLTSAQLDPKQLVDVLKQSGASTKVGEETIDGTPATHYRVTIDAKKALADKTKEQQAQAQKALKVTGATSFPVDIWVDDAGYLRRISTDFGAGANALFSIKAQLDLRDYGADVSVALPPADQVATEQGSFLPTLPNG